MKVKGEETSRLEDDKSVLCQSIKFAVICYSTNRKLIHKPNSSMQGQAGEPRPQLPEMVVTFPCLVPSHHKPLTHSQIPGFNIQIICPRSPLAAGRDTKSLVTPHAWLLVWRLCLCTHISDVHQLQKSSWNHPFILSCNNCLLANNWGSGAILGAEVTPWNRSTLGCWEYVALNKHRRSSLCGRH